MAETTRCKRTLNRRGRCGRSGTSAQAMVAGLAGIVMTTLGSQGVARGYCPNTQPDPRGWGSYYPCDPSSGHCVKYHYDDQCKLVDANTRCYVAGQVAYGWAYSGCQPNGPGGSPTCNGDNPIGYGGTYQLNGTVFCS